MRLEARTVAPPSLDVVKMEDRKRPGGYDDSAPPAKRQAVAVNGTRAHQDADLPWKEEIEAYQKDAILRQMREYKREKTSLETELKAIEKRSKQHNDHLQKVDLWFDQLLAEIKVSRGQDVTPSAQDILSRDMQATLLSSDTEAFSKYLSDRRERILSTLSYVITTSPTRSPEVSDLQQQITKLLSSESKLIADLQQANLDKEQVSDRLDIATRRYMIAEKKIDRIKSAQVQKLEQQAIAGGAVKEETPSVSNGADQVNGVANGALPEELETERDQALAEAAKRKEQIELLEAENKKLAEEVASLNTKIAGLSDDDYAKTDLFKAFKSQHEDTIKRVNHLEATNIQLREEAKKFQAERTEYRIKIDEETRATINETEGNVARAETDLARIRHSRDELLAKVQILESNHKNSDASREQTRELMAACESRIASLESECERLRLEIAEKKSTEGATDVSELTPEQLQGKIATLESQYKLLSNELPAMETAWKKAQAVAGKKLTEITTWEENINRANADKAKADQKFFATMKAKEMLEQQLRVLRTQANKSTEIVAQLKDADSTSRNLVDKMEKQTAEMKAQMEELSTQHRALQQKVNEGAITSDGQVSQIAELKKIVAAKETSYTTAKTAAREAEAQREKLAAQVQGLEKQCDIWKKKSQGNLSEESHQMQSMLQCQVCKNEFKDTVIKTCGHVFCHKCIHDRLVNRARKCPNCGKAFGTNDTMKVHL